MTTLRVVFSISPLPDVLHRGVDEGILLLLLLCCILLFRLRIMANLNILKSYEKLSSSQTRIARKLYILKGQAHEIEINYFDKNRQFED